MIPEDEDERLVVLVALVLAALMVVCIQGCATNRCREGATAIRVQNTVQICRSEA